MWLKGTVRNSFSISIRMKSQMREMTMRGFSCCSNRHGGFSTNNSSSSSNSVLSKRMMMMMWTPVHNITSISATGKLYQCSISQFSSISKSTSTYRLRAKEPGTRCTSLLPCTLTKSVPVPGISSSGIAFSSLSGIISRGKSTNSGAGGGGAGGAAGGGGSFHSIDNSNTISISKEGLKSRQQADAFLSVLSEEQKHLLYQSLHVEALRDKYMNELGSESHYLSKFGRPATSYRGTEDSTGTLTELSPTWLNTRLELPKEAVPIDEEKSRPVFVSAGDLWAVGLKNALPFVGFGFLDNLIMILAGDYIDLTIGAALGISTMAAAALGNTISDVAGIASAWYIEFFAEKIGIRDPVLTMTLAQQSSLSVRWSSNMGRAIGVVIGCLLGMLPLIFLPSAEEKKEALALAAAAAATAAANSPSNLEEVVESSNKK